MFQANEEICSMVCYMWDCQVHLLRFSLTMHMKANVRCMNTANHGYKEWVFDDSGVQYNRV